MKTNKQGLSYRPGLVARLNGQRFGLLTVVERAGSAGGFALWKCRCDCGREIIVPGSRLRQGRKNCCPSAEHKSDRRISLTNEYKSEYQSWRKMIERCENSNHKAFLHYGGRGITVCARWKVFRDFMMDMGRKPHPKFTIERNDVNGNYEPTNCKWISKVDQGRNKRNSVFVTYAGRKMLLIDAVDDMGLSRNVVYTRLKAGWTLAQALAIPLQKGGRPKGSKNKTCKLRQMELKASPTEESK